MIRTQVSLDRDAYREAKAEATRQGISLAEFVRRALSAALGAGKSGDRPWLRYAGTVSSRDRNASRSVNEVVYGRARP